MKKLLVLLGIIFLSTTIGCEEENIGPNEKCWLCDVWKYERFNHGVPGGPPIAPTYDWVYKGTDIICGKKPQNKYKKVKYDCELMP